MKKKVYSSDSLAIILLCSNLVANSKSDKFKPFTTVQWAKLAKIIFNSSLKKPANLFNLSIEEIKNKLLISEEESERISSLLSKAGQLSFELDNLSNKGIKIITRADEEYPNILRERLKEKCPPVIYYCGNIKILENKFIGIVGSRDINCEGVDFTKSISAKIVKEEYALVSGGAKGVDSIGQEEVLRNGGKVVSFVADSMISKIMKKETREAIISGNLLLMSTVLPSARFTVYSAMDRNKYIYALSEMTVVVASDYNKGGTWNGAIENLKHNWVPILVKSTGNVPKGNLEIIKRGGIALGSSVENKLLSDYIIDKKDINKNNYYQEDLLSLIERKSKEINSQKVNIIEEKNNIKESNLIYKKMNNVVNKDISMEKLINYDVYDLVKSLICSALRTELSLEELSEKLNVNKKQVGIWLKRCIEEGLVKKKNKPVRYISI
ncbi:DNA-processing protein DprA [Clostridium perfringens]|uniref:DNA-processing protein DprA n=1 Tax=Clostridium perfringens TaxID=1502 RepID=UPI002904DC9C|nr:DNA-processing protein DprA [Clostridium perfringens]MDU1811152.1 DNA-processing protein DprA [Clostridium perfringens]